MEGTFRSESCREFDSELLGEVPSIDRIFGFRSRGTQSDGDKGS